MTPDLKPPFYWERQIARIARALGGAPVTVGRGDLSRRRARNATFDALLPRVVDLGRSDYCEI